MTHMRRAALTPKSVGCNCLLADNAMLRISPAYAFNCSRRQCPIERINPLRLGDLVVDDKIHQTEQRGDDLRLVIQIQFARVNSVVPGDTDDIERLLNLGGQALLDEGTDIRVEV